MKHNRSRPLPQKNTTTNAQRLAHGLRLGCLLNLALIGSACFPSEAGHQFRFPVSAIKIGNEIAQGDYTPGKSNQQKEGQWRYWDADRHYLIRIEHYTGGVKNGPYQEFDSHGRLTYQTTYTAGQKDGWEKKRKRDGEYSRCRIKKGVLDGPCFRSYSENAGNKDWYQSGEFRNGQRQGKFVCYHRDGRIKVQGQYQDGLQIGQWVINPRNPDYLAGYKVYHYSQGKRVKVVYPKIGKVDHNPSQIKFHNLSSEKTDKGD